MILAIVMILAMACSALALQTTTFRVNGGAATVADDIEIATADRGIYVTNGGQVTNPGYSVTTSDGVGIQITGAGSYGDTYGDVTTTGDGAQGMLVSDTAEAVFSSGMIQTSGKGAQGAYARTGASADVTAMIITSGDDGYGVNVYDRAHMGMSGDIKTSGKAAYGAYANRNTTLIFNGTIKTSGDDAYGVSLVSLSSADLTGTITTTGLNANGLQVVTNAEVTMNGTITTTGDKASGLNVSTNSSARMTGDITTSGNLSVGARAAQESNVSVEGNITVNGTNGAGIEATKDSAAFMNDGTITVADISSSAVSLNDDGEATLTNVIVDSETLLQTITSGVLNAESSDLTGDVIHGGLGGDAETLEVNLKDSALEGAILTSPGVGTATGGAVDVALESSDWYVTGDSNTNGKVTGDANSSIDYSQAPEGTTVIIDELVGTPDISMKPGDAIGITNSTGNNSDFVSSNPDVLEVVQNDDGSWSVISKGEGDAELSYSYKDENGVKHTVTTGVSSAYSDGQSGPDNTKKSGGSSSNCNTGVGAAVFALLGLAFIQKRK